MVGEEASECRSMLEMSYPMENGMVRCWEDMLHLWDYTFGSECLDINPKECKVWTRVRQTKTEMNGKKNCTRTRLLLSLCMFSIQDPTDWATHEPDQKPRENRWNHVWEVPVLRHLRGHPGRAHSVRSGWEGATRCTKIKGLNPDLLLTVQLTGYLVSFNSRFVKWLCPQVCLPVL